MACGGNIAARLVSKAVLRLQRKGQPMTVTYDASRVTLVDHPLVQHKLSILRDKNTGTNQFRQLVRELALFDGYEAMRDLPMEDVEVETPITTATFKQLAGKKLAIVPILRAGLGMVDGILDLVPSARVGHIGMERDEVTHEPHEYYCKMPKDIDQRICLVVDPMLATGGSGDVLAGMIGAMFAQGYDMVESVLAAVYFHGLSAEGLEAGFTAGEIAPNAMALVHDARVSYDL